MKSSTAPKYTVRQVAVGDAAIIAGHRVGMFRDMGQVPTDALATALWEASTSAIAALLREGSYVGWFAIDENAAVLAGAGAHIKPQLPRISPNGDLIETAPVPLVVNVYTEPLWRGRGIARTLMYTLMKWSKGQRFDRVLLHASDAGRLLYESLGFVATNEMRWIPTRDRQLPGI